MGQLQPRHPSSRFCSHKVGVDKLPNGLIVEPRALRRFPEHLATDALFGDEMLVEPRTEITFGEASLLGHHRDRFRVEATKRFADIALRLNQREVDLILIIRQLIPEAVADHLQLNRFDIGACALRD